MEACKGGCLLKTAIAAAVVFSISGAGGTRADRIRPAAKQQHQGVTVTAIVGPSWISHLGLTLSQTQMGRAGGMEPAPPDIAREEPDLVSGATSQEVSVLLERNFLFTGADLYRISCRSCHGIDGAGAPPEIPSLMPFLAAFSDVPPQKGGVGLLAFLKNPGERMPPLPDWEKEEATALVSYLQELSSAEHLPDGSRGHRIEVTESAARVGEHLVTGTCHICHNATGPGNGYYPMMRGIIPSLASFPNYYSLGTVEHAVEYGSSSMMMMMRRRESMPPLPYLTRKEIAAAYFYLVGYPPKPQEFR